jgi:hypothetical protein
VLVVVALTAFIVPHCILSTALTVVFFFLDAAVVAPLFLSVSSVFSHHLSGMDVLIVGVD